MATPPLSLELAEETVDRVNAALRAGFRPMGRTGPGNGAVTEAATRGIEDGFVSTVSGFESRLRRAKQLYQLEPDWSLYRQNRYQQPVARLHVVPAPPTDSTPDEPTGEITRHLVIPDEHNDPRHPHRLHVQTWIARYGSEHRHDTVIKLGDSGSFDSVSRHDRNDTYKGRLKPFISDDLKNHEASLAAFERGRGDWLPKKKRFAGTTNSGFGISRTRTPKASEPIRTCMNNSCYSSAGASGRLAKSPTLTGSATPIAR